MLLLESVIAGRGAVAAQTARQSAAIASRPPCPAAAAVTEAQEERGTEADATAAALYDRGYFETAATAARAQNTADGYALAARAGLVAARFCPSGSGPLRRIAEALRDAEAALAIDPRHVEAHLQAALALGYRGRLRGSARDARSGLEHIDAALTEAPQNPWALAALGGWHAEVVLQAGAFVGRIWFGARRSRAIRQYHRAVAADPDNLAIHAHFGETLLRFGKKKYRAEARQVLERAVGLEPGNAFDAILRAHSRQLLSALQSGDGDTLEDLLDRTDPFADGPDRR